MIADLPGLEVEKVGKTLSRFTSTTANLPLPTAPENWPRAVLQGASVLWLLTDNIPTWGGMVTEAERNQTDVIPISLATVEAYLDRKFVGDEVFLQVGQNVIVQTLVDKYAAAGSNGGIPIRVVFTTPGDGKLRDLKLADDEDKSLYSVLQALAGLKGGPEWTIVGERQHEPERITFVLLVGDRVGVAAPAGLGPQATFDMPGCVTDFKIRSSYANGSGANDVMAVSTATADVRPQSAHQIVLDDIRPTFEERWTPSTSITITETLDDHAAAALAILRNGSAAVSLTASTDAAPQLDTDWGIGDDIGYVIGGTIGEVPDQVESVPSVPGGLAGVARCIGWEQTFGANPTITPTLLATTLET
ncbi:hypothetical protein [Cryobacterium aureum]|uniref:hypothetical protein n=1 Tax=Cryobacterium aureum TaxID=995037 RepID=UPI000CF4C67D|nr:hypothetical protein [Cryobacterium aureum]